MHKDVVLNRTGTFVLIEHSTQLRYNYLTDLQFKNGKRTEKKPKNKKQKTKNKKELKTK
tara:strand:- start:3313 stop:3489 length:177 start_codon:yes stop_codon:yes gene_type:complete